MKILEDAISLLEEEKDILISDDVNGLVEITKKKEKLFVLLSNSIKHKRFSPDEKREVLSLLERIKRLNERNMYLVNVAKSLNEYTLKICKIPVLEGRPVQTHSFEAKV